jgi:hypothetical protein
LLACFARAFSKPVWRLAHGLLVGALLAPPKRTVTAARRAMGLSQDRPFEQYHRVLNGDPGRGRRLSRILLGRRVTTLVAVGLPVLIGIDEPIERRWGPKIIERGSDRDPVRSSQSPGVQASGLRWISLLLSVAIPWIGRAWALPFLSVVAPSQGYAARRGRKQRTGVDKAAALLRWVREWLPDRERVIAGDGA